jgi:hypothetical protein
VSFAWSAGKRVRLLRLTPEPKPAIIGIAASAVHYPLEQKSSCNVLKKRRQVMILLARKP